MLVICYIASLTRWWWIAKDREGHDLGVIEQYHGICEAGLGRISITQTVCVPAVIPTSIFSKSFCVTLFVIEVTTLLILDAIQSARLKWRPSVTQESISREYCEVDIVDYMYRLGEQQRTKKSDSFCRVNLWRQSHQIWRDALTRPLSTAFPTSSLSILTQCFLFCCFVLLPKGQKCGLYFMLRNKERGHILCLHPVYWIQV
jgi:hypothetical protein